MNKDVFARKNLDLFEQLKELKDYVTQYGAGLNLSVSEINLIVQLCDEYRAQIMVVINKRTEFKTAAALKKDMRTTHLTPLRKFLTRLKNPTPGNPKASLPNFKSRLTKPDNQTYIPKLKAHISAGEIVVGFKKLGMEQMQIWGSLNGGSYQLLGTHIRSPFVFKPAPLPDNAPQHWKLKALGIFRDKAFGKYSAEKDVFYTAPEL